MPTFIAPVCAASCSSTAAAFRLHLERGGVYAACRRGRLIMCGMAGIMSRDAVDERLVRRMTRAIARRGPDDEGVWVDSEAGIGLGNRRLAIIDLSPAGHQPMQSSNGRLVLTFNGEIYNH